MKIKRFISIFLLVFSLASCSAEEGHINSNSNSISNTDKVSVKQGYRQITVDEAVDLMERESNYIILDVRRPDEFESGHIPNAINVPNENIGTEEIAELPNKAQLILVYCRSGRRSKEASEKLVSLGYTNIVEFGGILDWKGETEIVE